MNKNMHKMVGQIFNKEENPNDEMEFLRRYAALQIFIISGLCLLAIIGKMIYKVGFKVESLVILTLTCLNVATIGIYKITKSFKAYLTVGVIICFAVIIYVHIMLGGFRYSSGEILWGIAAVVSVFIALGEKYAKISFYGYIATCVFLYFGEYYWFPTFFNRPKYLLGVSFSAINAVGIVALVYATLEVFLPSLEKQFSRSQELVSTLELSNKAVKDAMVELKSTQSILVQKEKMASLGQLIAGIAHEINTPIGAIKASAQFICSTVHEKINPVTNEINALDNSSIDIMQQIITRSITKKESIPFVQKRQVKKKLIETFEQAGKEDPTNLASVFIEMELFTTEDIEFLNSIKDLESLDIIANNAYLLSAVYRGADNIDFATEKITKIIFALKSFSHYDSFGNAVEANIEDCIDNVLTLYHNQLKSGVTMQKEYNMEQKVITCYPDELNQVWTNIIHNSIHAMKNHGNLIIETKNDNENVYISFTDTGCGISPENLKRIFEPFFTSKPIGEGTGLGLDISKRIVEKHNGRFIVESTVDVGSTFTVILPINYTND